MMKRFSILATIFMVSTAYAENVSFTATSLVGVDEEGNQLIELVVQTDGKVRVTRENRASVVFEAVPNMTQDCSGYDLGPSMQLTMCPGVSGMGAYRDRVNHYYIDFDGKHIELRPNVELNIK